MKIKVEDLIEELLKNNTALQPAPESSNDQHNEGQQENTCSSSGQNGARESLSFSKSLIPKSSMLASIE